MSSAATNVGSPPSVRRTSPAASALSTSSPSVSICVHCSSEYGSVTRGGPASRRTVLECSNVTSHGSVAPEIGAAVDGCGEQTSGRCPSPASRPDVGSRPIQPAPGTYASAHACRSVKSSSGPARTVERHLVGPQLHEVTRHEPRREPDLAKDVHEQPRAVAARPDRLPERLVRRLHAGFHARRVGDRAEHALVDAHEEVDDGRAVAGRRRGARPTNRAATARAAGRARRVRGTARDPARSMSSYANG